VVIIKVTRFLSTQQQRSNRRALTIPYPKRSLTASTAKSFAQSYEERPLFARVTTNRPKLIYTWEDAFQSFCIGESGWHSCGRRRQFQVVAPCAPGSSAVVAMLSSEQQQPSKLLQEKRLLAAESPRIIGEAGGGTGGGGGGRSQSQLA
jgi:hypothetical protein